MREDLALIAAIADDLPVGVWVASAPEGRILYANRAFAEIVGVPPERERIAGAPPLPYRVTDRAGAPYPQERLPFWRALREGATVTADDIVVHRQDGRTVHLRVFAQPVRDERGVITRVVVALLDISAEVHLDAERLGIAAELHTVLAHAPLIVFRTELDGVITLAHGRGLGRLRNPMLVGASLFTSYGQLPVIAESAHRVLAGEDARYVVSSPTGVFETWLGPTRGDGGAITGIIGVTMDVTDRARAEEQLAQAERLASLGLLAAGVAHEVNNPLAYVVTNLDVIAREAAALPDETRARAERALADARDGVGRVAALVKDLKLFARVGERVARDVDPRVPLAAALGLASNETRHRARVLRELGAVPVVRADEGRLAQLFLNLLVNAAQAIPEGAAESHEIRVVTRTTDDGMACIEVIDTGMGMDEETRRRAFDPFFTTKDPGTGTGLGLAICHSIATSIGGRIEVESTPGAGSTFRVLLPHAPAQPASDTTPVAGHTSSLPPGRGDEARPRRRRVLVVDDEPLIVRAVTPLLEGEYDVTTETRADAALRRVTSGERFDVILCDLMMPEMSGMDLHEALTRVAPEQAGRMLFVSGGAFTARAAAFLARARHPTLEKPFDVETMLARIRAVASR